MNKTIFDSPYMSVEEFVELGYLQELNRQFLHPLGLALSVFQGDDDQWFIRGILDAREDREGVVFENRPSPKKAAHVEAEREKRASGRRLLMGDVVQPLSYPAHTESVDRHE